MSSPLNAAINAEWLIWCDYNSSSGEGSGGMGNEGLETTAICYSTDYRLVEKQSQVSQDTDSEGIVIVSLYSRLHLLNFIV